MIVQCEYKYWGSVLKLRNLLRDGFFNNEIIEKEEHSEFMRKHAANYYVYLVGEEVVGFVGVVNNDIRVGVHPFYQNKGKGVELVKHVASLYPSAKAEIAVTNIASMSLFNKCGFVNSRIVMEQK